MTPSSPQPRPPADGPPEVADRRRAVSGGLWNAASSVAPMAGTLALSVVISRRLGPDVLGAQSLVAYVTTLLVSVLIYSATTASVQMLAASGAADSAGRLVWLSRWSSRAHLGAGVVVAAVLVSVGVSRSDYRELWFLAAATSFVDAVGWAHASREVSRRGWAPVASRRLVAQALSPVLAVVVVLLGSGVAGVFATQLVVSCVLAAVLWQLERRGRPAAAAPSSAPPWRPVVSLWGLFGLSVLITQVVERRLELVFLDVFQDARTVAMYSVAFNVVAIPTVLSGSLSTALIPAIAARHAVEPGSVAGALGRAARTVITVDLLLAAGTVSVGPGLVMAAYGAAFDDAAGLVRWLGLTLLFVPLSQLCSAFWSGTGRLRPVLMAGGTAAVVDVALAGLLIPSLALTGAVIATMTAQATAALVIVTYTVRHGLALELRLQTLWRAVFVAVLAGGGAAATAALVPGLAGDLLAVPVFVLLAAAGARRIGVLAPQDAEWLATSAPGPLARLTRVLTPSRG